jgi:uncharacterized RDD family membrane protein YckC
MGPLTVSLSFVLLYFWLWVFEMRGGGGSLGVAVADMRICVKLTD